MTTIDIAAGAFANCTGIIDMGGGNSTQQHTETTAPDSTAGQDASFQTNSLISDLALLLVVGAVAAIIFKKLKLNGKIEKD